MKQQKKETVSLLITAWKEPDTIGKTIRAAADPKENGGVELHEILLAAPDTDTKNAAEKEIQKLGLKKKYRYIQDPAKGKNYALNMLFEQATGDIWILTDGDVWFGENAVAHLLEPFTSEEIYLVTGRPKSADDKSNMMEYFGNLLSDAAHHKRKIDLGNDAAGRSLRFVSKEKFFPASGYIYAIRNTDIRLPKDTLVDDAYISYKVFNEKGRIAYAPNAVAYVKYPQNLADYFKQKKRSAGGYVQLWKYGVVKPDTVTRSFKKELQYFWYPIKYAQNPKQLLWSLFLYPIRFWQWAVILWEQKILKKDLMNGAGWERIESTK